MQFYIITAKEKEQKNLLFWVIFYNSRALDFSQNAL